MAEELLNLICPGCRAAFRAAASEVEAACPECGEILWIPHGDGPGRAADGGAVAGREGHPDGSAPFRSTEEVDDPNVQEFVGEDGQVRRKRRVRKRKRKPREIEAEDWEKRKIKHRRWREPLLAGAGVVILLAGLLVGRLLLSDTVVPEDAPERAGASGLLTERHEEDQEDAEKYEIAEQQMKDVVKGFLAAEDLAELAHWIREPERVLPLMREFYAREDQELRPVSWKAIGEDQSVAMLGTMTAVLVTLDDYSQRQVALEKTCDGFLVDWESWVGYSEMSWVEFQRRRPVKPVLARVFMSRRPYYNFDFADDSKWLSFRIVTADEGALWGYALADGAPLRFATWRAGGPEKLMTVRLRYPENATRADQVVIDGLVVEGWVLHPDATGPGR